MPRTHLRRSSIPESGAAGRHATAAQDREIKPIKRRIMPNEGDSRTQPLLLAREDEVRTIDGLLGGALGRGGVRTSLALIGFGFGINRIVETMRSQQHGYHPNGLTAFVTLAFIALGVYGIVAASRDYREQLRALSEARYEYRSRPSHTLTIAVILAIVGGIAFVGVLLQAMFR